MNKGEIRAHFKALLNRSDCTDALADTFLNQALTRIQRILRIPPMERMLTYTVSANTSASQIVLPSDLLEIIDIQYSGRSLVRIPIHEMAEQQRIGAIGSPEYFCRERELVKLAPAAGAGSIYMTYYAEVAPLDNDTDINVLTVIASDLLTYTALSYAADYFLDERGALFETKSGQFLAEIQEQANSAEMSGVTQVMRPTRTYED